MTAPLVESDVNLRGMQFMPLDVIRVLDSDLYALSTGEEFKYALTLWCRAWLQVPAASLPSDDRVLAKLSGAGERWEHVKAMVMHGFVLCDDGRFYHPIIAEKAKEAWVGRSRFEAKNEHERERQRRHREERKELFAALRVHGVVPPWDTPSSKLREELDVLAAAAATCHAPVTRTSRVTSAPVTRDVTAKRGRGRGTVTGTVTTTSPTTDTPEVGGAGGEPPAPSAPAGRKKATRLDEHWKLPKRYGVWALEQNPRWTPDAVKRVAAVFHNHWLAKAGRDGAKQDWFATWRNWVLREMEGAGLKGARATRGAEKAALAAKMRGAGHDERPDDDSAERDITADSRRVA